jgi:ribonuclease E
VQDEDVEEPAEAAEESVPQSDGQAPHRAQEQDGEGRKRRRRRRRGGRDRDRPSVLHEPVSANSIQTAQIAAEDGEAATEDGVLAEPLQSGQSQGEGGRRKRRRRRRGRRGGHGDTDTQTHGENGGHDDGDHDDIGIADAAPERLAAAEPPPQAEPLPQKEQTPSPQPNAPSDPVWSFFGSATDTAAEPEERPRAPVPEQAVTSAPDQVEPLHEDAPEKPEGPPRKGWWQRRFG